MAVFLMSAFSLFIVLLRLRYYFTLISAVVYFRYYTHFDPKELKRRQGIVQVLRKQQKGVGVFLRRFFFTA